MIGYLYGITSEQLPTWARLPAGDKRYQLTQFHFHRPSEEYIQGKPYDIVLRLMQKSTMARLSESQFF
jgi:carbonic anhydrase